MEAELGLQRRHVETAWEGEAGRQAGRGNGVSRSTEVGRRGGTWKKGRPVKCGSIRGPISRAWGRDFIHVSEGEPPKISEVRK